MTYPPSMAADKSENSSVLELIAATKTGDRKSLAKLITFAENTPEEFKDLTLDERLKIVTQLPYFISDKIYKAIMTKEDEYNLQDFLVVKDPLTDEIVLRISKNITFEVMQKAIEYLFTEDLGNIYRAFYNMVNYAGFDANYVDTITPVEMQVYWMYFMQDREESSSNSNRTQGAALPQSTLNTELGF